MDSCAKDIRLVYPAKGPRQNRFGKQAQQLLQQAQQYAGSVRVTEQTQELGQVRVYEPDTDPYTVLRLHVAGKRLWWRELRPYILNEWVGTDAFWIGTDARLWVGLEAGIFAVVTEVAPSVNPLWPHAWVVQAPAYSAQGS